jgi:hypothetical protein
MLVTPLAIAVPGAQRSKLEVLKPSEIMSSLAAGLNTLLLGAGNLAL